MALGAPALAAVRPTSKRIATNAREHIWTKRLDPFVMVAALAVIPVIVIEQ
jgi:hypothetical protein